MRVCLCFYVQAVVCALYNVCLCSFTNPLYLFFELYELCPTIELLEHFICVCSVYIVFNYRAFGAPGEAGKVTIAHPAQHNTLAAAHVGYMNYEPLILPHSPWNCLLIKIIPKWRISKEFFALCLVGLLSAPRCALVRFHLIFLPVLTTRTPIQKTKLPAP